MPGIKKHVFEPEYAISKNLVELSRKELCTLVAEICRQVNEEVGSSGFRGGIYPENISRNPDGIVGIGPARKSDWSEEELRYIAPEIYWNNKACPQSDVYSLGLLLFYGASAGKLPFEGESNNAQLMRMSGKTVYSPAAAGLQLGNVIEKALRFKEGERYRSPKELAVMLDYCEEKRLLNSSSGSLSLFHKEESELSEMEHMMMDIIENGENETAKQREAGGSEPAPSEENALSDKPTEEEIFSAAGLQKPEPQKKEREAIHLEDYFGLDEPDPREPAELEEEEEIRVYEPGKKQGIPILTEDTEPELAPVTVKKKNNGKAARESEVMEQRKRPFLVVLLLLAVLLIAAAVARILIYAFSENGGRVPSNVTVVSQTAEPSETFDVSAILSEEQIQYQQQQAEQQAQQQELEQEPVTPTVDPATLPHSYEAVRADVSWTEAQSEAAAKGGYLVTINSAEELETIISLAREAGFDRIWIGAHRVNGTLVWESGEDVGFYRWDDGEPSYTDSGDGAAEDYVMLWERNGKWVYNDSRENPLTDFYGMYGGRIGYVVERVG